MSLRLTDTVGELHALAESRTVGDTIAVSSLSVRIGEQLSEEPPADDRVDWYLARDPIRRVWVLIAQVRTRLGSDPAAWCDVRTAIAPNDGESLRSLMGAMVRALDDALVRKRFKGSPELVGDVGISGPVLLRMYAEVHGL